MPVMSVSFGRQIQSLDHKGVTVFKEERETVIYELMNKMIFWGAAILVSGFFRDANGLCEGRRLSETTFLVFPGVTAPVFPLGCTIGAVCQHWNGDGERRRIFLLLLEDCEKR